MFQSVPREWLLARIEAAKPVAARQLKSKERTHPTQNLLPCNRPLALSA